MNKRGRNAVAVGQWNIACRIPARDQALNGWRASPIAEGRPPSAPANLAQFFLPPLPLRVRRLSTRSSAVAFAASCCALLLALAPAGLGCSSCCLTFCCARRSRSFCFRAAWSGQHVACYRCSPSRRRLLRPCAVAAVSFRPLPVLAPLSACALPAPAPQCAGAQVPS